MHNNDLSNGDFTDVLNQREGQNLLRFVTCGSVDDGKSTLIGRLLYESNTLYEDQRKALDLDSQTFGSSGQDLDYALLLDGLLAEREQGITIDVAYRFFSTAKRSFIVADSPGHEQYTRNMATAASVSDLGILLVDARKGILPQTKRHAFILSLFGVRQLILAVNKMDLMDYDPQVIERIENDFRAFAKALNVEQIQVIPVSALKGDNLIQRSSKMPWYQGPSLLTCLEDIEIQAKEAHPFRMPVQWVNRAHSDFRGYAGRIASGHIQKGDRIRVQPSGKESRIKQIFLHTKELEQAIPGQSITLTLEDELDISRGDVLSSVQNPCQIADQFQSMMLWLNEKPLISGRQYLFKLGTMTAFCTVKSPKYRLDINHLEKLAAKALELNEIGCCEIALDRKISFEPYAVQPELGAFILIDRISNATVAAGVIEFALNRSINVFKQNLLVSQSMRSAIKEQKPCVIWLTGLSGAGKSTIANLVEQQLHAMGLHTMLLDGDNIRHGLNRDLGFSEACRAENIRRIAEVCRLMTEAGLITLVSFISPYRADRDMARQLIGEANFYEIFIDTPLEIAELRDTKGLYKKAREGVIKNFTGINSPYEKPPAPDLTLDTSNCSPEASAQQLIDFLRLKQVL